MSQLIFRRENGGTGMIPAGRAGDVLIGGTLLPEWRKLDAGLVPYTSAISKTIPNVSAGLDEALSALHEMQARLGRLENAVINDDRRHEQLLGEVGIRSSEVGRLVRETSDRLTAMSHKPVALPRVTNPALTLNAALQEIRLDLTALNSYNDLRTQMGQTSIQGAIEQTYTLVYGLIGEVNTLRDELAQLTAKVEMKAST